MHVESLPMVVLPRGTVQSIYLIVGFFYSFLLLSEIFKLLAHCGMTTVNCSVKLPIVSAHQIIVIRETEHGKWKERGMCTTFGN